MYAVEANHGPAFWIPRFGMIGTDVVLTVRPKGSAMLTATIAMVVFSVVLERYYMRKLTLLETGLFGVCCVLLMFPQQMADFIGLAMFMGLTLFVYMTKEKPCLEPAYE